MSETLTHTVIKVMIVHSIPCFATDGLRFSLVTEYNWSVYIPCVSKHTFSILSFDNFSEHISENVEFNS